MSTPTLAQILKSVHFISVPDGRRFAVLDADGWESLMEWLEDFEDTRIIQQSLTRLREGPKQAGAIPLDQVLNEL